MSESDKPVIEMEIDGVPVRVNDPELAMKLIEMHNQRRSPQATPSRNGGNAVSTVKPRKTADFIAFWKDLENGQKRLLQAISAADSGLLTDELARAMSIETRELPYALRRIQSAAQAHGINLADIFTRFKVSVGRKPKSKYKATARLGEYLRQVETE